MTADIGVSVTGMARTSAERAHDTIELLIKAQAGGDDFRDYLMALVALEANELPAGAPNRDRAGAVLVANTLALVAADLIGDLTETSTEFLRNAQTATDFADLVKRLEKG